jgi:tRNA nucleotidyltransferase (CCA-adding enzyme)
MRRRGFLPVGKAFPVFLHPDTKDEYALARTERKTGPGYHGFVFHADPSVTLEQDLARRDLTINAMAETPEGDVVDPYGGLGDLAQRRLRHVSAAFSEDPVRILRTARFAARLHGQGFRVADETLALMREMVANGEVDALVPERVWQEVVKVLGDRRSGTHLSVFFTVLRDCGALARLLPELDRLWGVPQPEKWHPEIDTGVHVMLVLDQAARLSPNPEVRFAALCHDLGKGTTPSAILPSHHGHEERGVVLLDTLCARLRVPKRFCELARITARYHGKVHKVDELRAATIHDLFEGVDLFRRPERFEAMLLACEADFRGRTGYAERPYPQADRLRQFAQAARAVDAGALARECRDRSKIPMRLRAARIRAIRAAREK